MTTGYKRGENPRSLKNLKRTAGPGRPKMTLEKRITERAIREYMKEYLENGEAVIDFERVRYEKPDIALNMALDRVYGHDGKPQGESSAFNVNMLIAVLTGKGPEAESAPIIEVGVAEKALIPDQNP